MTFQSFAFLGFFMVALAVILSLARRSVPAGRAALTIASGVFYLWGFGNHALWGALILALGVTATGVSARTVTNRQGVARRLPLFLGVGWHLGMLLAFKYADFFTGGALSLGWAPLGLSFFTFQQIWYLKEVYTGKFQPVSPPDLMLYAFFFPTVSSGPILRPAVFFPQLTAGRFLRPDWRDAAAGLYGLSIGLAKKLLLADAFGALVNNGYAHADQLTAPGAWLVMLGYTLQLYFDFSGYCDMAAGIARLLGVRLPPNFDSPYRATSVGEFWKRWHITLTTFLRECLYFPLGGGRRGTLRTYGNILLVFLLSGLWHGAGWTFLVWGGLHGLAQIVERAWGNARNRLPKTLRWAGTFLFVNLAWVFFRAPSLAAAGGVLAAAVTGGRELHLSLLTAGFLSGELNAVGTLVPALAGIAPALAVGALYGTGLLAVLLPGNTIRRMEDFRPTAWRCAACAALLAWSVLSFTGITTFLYSNF